MPEAEARPVHPPQGSFYWPQLDGLRAIACLLVFFHHLGAPNRHLVDDASLPIYLLFGGLSFVVRWGWVGVELFFTLSAFLITWLLLEERARFARVDFPWFFRRRALRIWPLYYLALTLAVGLSWSGWWPIPLPPERMGWFLALHSIFLGNFYYAWNATWVPFPGSPLWSVCLEEQFYFVWGLTLSKVASTHRLLLGLVGAFLSCLLLRAWVQSHSQTDIPYYYNSFTHLDSVVLGAGASVLMHSWPALQVWLERHVLGLVALGMGLAGLIAVLVPPTGWVDARGMLATPFISLCCLLSLLCALYWRPLSSLLSRPAMVWLGRLTYGIYVFHYAILEIVHSLLEPYFTASGWPVLAAASLFWLVKLGLALPATLLVALLSWNWLEEPCLRLKRYYTKVPSGRSLVA